LQQYKHVILDTFSHSQCCQCFSNSSMSVCPRRSISNKTNNEPAVANHA